ncbi:MAG: carbon-nitrogen hydrolase family protein [Deltaproteobacteria bacterium]|nr:carbon-nitrogen hydrolase family protein [Deltaproteobacteria bacterium]
MDAELLPGTESWAKLIAGLGRAQPDIFVLNELPFGPWLSARSSFDPVAWKQSVADHEAGIAALHELGVGVILGTRSVERQGRRCNEGFVWTRQDGIQATHTKQYIPNTPPSYCETVWYEPGERKFEIVQAGPLRVGFLICSDVMFTEHARRYGRDGVHLIVVPRAMPVEAAHMFDVALKMAAISSGCYVASSNRYGADSAGGIFEGRGCIVDPGGQTVAESSQLERVVVHEISTEFVSVKQNYYPCDLE